MNHGRWTDTIPGSAVGLRPRLSEPVLVALLAVDLLLFAGGATAHSGVPIPLGIGTWTEPLVVPAAIIEGLCAAGIAITLVTIARRTSWARRLASWVLWFCFLGVLWGMAQAPLRLAMGSIPGARTISNDFLHIAMTLVTTAALVRLAVGTRDRKKNSARLNTLARANE
jgi:hypothetical protein